MGVKIKMLNVKYVALFLCIISFILIFRFQIIANHIVNGKFEYMKDNFMYRNKKCFYLKWKNTFTSLSELRRYQCTGFITIAHSMGRTGNNLFQIATILGLAYKHDLIPLIPVSFPLHTFFNLPNIVDLKKESILNNIYLREKSVASYMNFSKKLSSGIHNFTLKGGFQSWKYFDTGKVMIKNALRLKYIHFKNAEGYMKRMNPAGYKQISIHIRRGDFKTAKHIKRGFSVVDERFVENAKNILRQNATNVVFFVVTNDRQWCKENLKNVNISPFDNPGDDLALMTLSDHVVVSAGTFGWWGAWLSGGNVVYYKEYPRSKSKIASFFNKYDYYPPDWIGII